ncbi:hypothetical protein F3157_01255 [Virgibacillus dakarensis]|uniref:Uncharacterized protein n=1 Tax=Lentibacillus populi TaxID=1827502 RepID=A0A9W5TTV9_9BACI|nr:MULTISPECIES: hypothetical protein [Bacillaceae]MBT2216576.1 hypothetical protein [Virgibacillus dakarensis]MTW84298.1 hypothetical protein [Virgibacillus dakarensis]GGB27515.1 hypothetical protein GCM10011409_01000 [Lentibacillus populi]
MRHYTVLRLLLACFFLYFAWPLIPQAASQLEIVFWGIWLIFLLLVVGANLATLLRMTSPPVMEQERVRSRETVNH